MEELDIYKIVARQVAITDELLRLQSNISKDGPGRKTLDYARKRLDVIESLWSEFEKNHKDIEDVVKHDTPYIQSDTAGRVKQIYESLTQHLSAIKDGTSERQADKEAPKEQGKNTSHSLTSKTNQGTDTIKVFRRQKAIAQSLKRLLENIEEGSEDYSGTCCRLKIDRIKGVWSQMEEVHQQIAELLEDPVDAGYDIEEYLAFEDRVQKNLLLLAVKLEGGHPEPRHSDILRETTNLPKITLPKFDGNYLTWRQYHDLFTELIHNRKIADCQKLFYLKTTLEGEAEKLIRHFTTSDANYHAAWKVVTERYENPRLLVSALINKLMAQPTCQQETANQIKALHDTTVECLLGLKNLKIDIANWDPLVMSILMKKLDRNTLTLWEQSLKQPKELQPLDIFLKFLETRFQSLEAIGGKSSKRDEEERRRTHGFKVTSSITTQKKDCTLCKAPHQLYACRAFLDLTPSNRLSHVRNNKLCVNCLKDGHTSYDCRHGSCSKCSKKHNTLVHLTKRELPNSNNHSIGQTIQESTNKNTTLAAAGINKKESYVFLSTVIVNLEGQDGSTINCRAVLDSGSQISIITERMIRKLKIPLSFKPMIIQGVGSCKRGAQKRANISLRSKTTDFTARLEAIVLPQIISPQPTQAFDVSTWKIPGNIKLADSQFNKPDHIDLLIGAELFHQLLCVGQIKLGSNLPLLQNTLLGWIVTGRVKAGSTTTTTCGIFAEESSLENAITKFWQTEELPCSNSKRTIAEEKCEEYFNQSTSRNTSGRFIVSLPFADDPTKLGSSSDIALNRFHALERRLNRHPELQKQYTEFMNEYIQLGHMTEIDFKTVSTPHYFLPHHCVLKPDSSSTKLRVVFDASAKTSSNTSLNDILYAGPTIQDDLFTILLRFRLPRFVIKADIQKMYRQILVREEDLHFQLIWWRSHQNQPIKCYKLQTVTYGTTSAPYLATKCLQALAKEYNTKYPLGSQVLQKDFYVDDVMTGADSMIEAKEIQTQLSALLREGGFQLKKWCSNKQQLLANVPLEDQEISLSDDRNESSVKTLGLMWRPKSDIFCIKTNYRTSKRFTKRSVASDIARLFDPLGIVAPVVVVAKLFLQELWELKYDWDAALPEEMHTRWDKYYKGLRELDTFQIPRHVFSHHIPSSVQIHTFADASERAYGAAVFIRSLNKEGTVIVRLLCSKSRVAPTTKTASGMRSMTIPRLELCAALLAAELSQRVKGDLNLGNTSSFLWSDSQIVLSWINSSAESFQTFVGRRVAKIQSHTSADNWRYVRSSENPADVLSRGISPEKLQDHTLWKYGPRFLHGSEAIWPPPFKNSKTWSDERKNAALVTSKVDTQKHDSFEGIRHSNSFPKLKTIMAYCFRFTSLVKSGKLKESLNSVRQNQKRNKSPWPITTSELETSLQFIVKEIQFHGFYKDICFLKANKELEKDSPLKGLAVFLDADDILRVGGRLQESSLPYDSKHPILLPYSHPYVEMIMTDLHIQNNHIGPQGLLAITRQRFWPIKGKNIARSITQHCTFCIRAKPHMYSQMMGNLPGTRVQPARPFINTGVDFCGPLWVHYRTRGSRPQKCYLSMFCCFATKAVHIEVVSDLTTEAFLGALRRFMSRRGHVKNLYCDNATNFVGAKNQLEELKTNIYSAQAQNKIATSCSSKGIDFHFIPPRAPHFGGLWEAAVKSAKHLLQCKLANASLTYEELCTITAEVEAILNSRPLTAMSNDPSDLNALTPSHFLIGDSLRATIDTKAEPVRGSLLTRWKLVSHIKREFWNRWSLEYLNELQYRTKWKKQSNNIKIGTIVIMKEDNTPIMKWPLGRIEHIHVGKDGLVRVADVRTKSGMLRRPIHKLAPLIENDEVELNPPSTDRKRRSDRSTPDETTTSKAARNSTNLNPLTTMLLIGLLLPAVLTSDIEVTTFNNTSPGMHFHRHGTISLIHNKWNIIVFYNLEPYRMEFEALENTTTILNHVCKKLSPNELCLQVVHQFQVIKNELNEDNLIGTTKTSIRKRRGAVDVVGNIANSLFGVLDSKYAEDISQKFKGIEINEDHLMRLLKNHTSILDSTINIVRLSQEDSIKRKQALDQQLSQLFNSLSNVTEELYQTKMKELFLSWCTHATLVIINIQRMQTSIADVLTDTHRGRVNHLLITHQQLVTEVAKIRNHLPPGLRIAVEPDQILQLYNLMNVEGHISSNYITFKIEVPLLSLEEFSIYKLIPIPAPANNTYIIIQPSTDMLAVSAHHDQYYPITESELSKCLTLNGNHHLCMQTHPVYQSGTNLSMCEMNLLNNNSEISTCELKFVKAESVWTKLPDTNQWIFSLNKEAVLNVVCNHQTSFLALKGSGLLKLQPNCVAKDKHLTLQGQQIYSSTVQASYTRITNNNIHSEDVIRLASPQYNMFNLSSFSLELNKLREQIKLQQLELPTTISLHNTPHFVLSSVGLIIIFIALVFFIYKKIKGRQKPPHPVPSPRTTNSSSYTISI